MTRYPTWRLIIRFRAPTRTVQLLRDWVARMWPQIEARLTLIDDHIEIAAPPEIFDDPGG